MTRVQRLRPLEPIFQMEKIMGGIQVGNTPASTVFACFSWEMSGYLSVDFDPSCSYSMTGSVVAWEWDFGDGGTDTAEFPTHTYAAAGTYTVTLKVWDANGNVSEVSAPLVMYHDDFNRSGSTPGLSWNVTHPPVVLNSNRLRISRTNSQPPVADAVWEQPLPINHGASAAVSISFSAFGVSTGPGIGPAVRMSSDGLSYYAGTLHDGSGAAANRLRIYRVSGGVATMVAQSSGLANASQRAFIWAIGDTVYATCPELSSPISYIDSSPLLGVYAGVSGIDRGNADSPVPHLDDWLAWSIK